MSLHQPRNPEIQELRHRSQSAGDLPSATSVIDQSLLALDERLEAVSQGIDAVDGMLVPSQNGLSGGNDDVSERGLLLRKHASLMSEWGSVQEESDVLREELKEDKWLTVFRTVTDQADGMMSSLEKAVNRCQVCSSCLAYILFDTPPVVLMAIGLLTPVGFRLASP